jgi:hypothetical protein
MRPCWAHCLIKNSLLVTTDSLSALANDEAGHSTDITIAAPSPVTETLKVLQLIMANNRNIEHTLQCRQRAKELKRAVKHLPAIATSYMSAMQSLVVASTIDGKCRPPTCGKSCRTPHKRPWKCTGWRHRC